MVGDSDGERVPRSTALCRTGAVGQWHVHARPGKANGNFASGLVVLLAMDSPLRFAGIVVLTAVLLVVALMLVPGQGKPSRAVDPKGSVGSPVMPVDPGYWTPERMAEAQPMPMPTPR
jgi:hypothetical protein